ncbi:hypothetical protein RZO55_23730 [Clostridium boliviensis]|uniref:Uncharacterized protein n=1 Tax=Clostridium boliviensis TaxID=318465 RepID=A0ABU4GSH0_9CLOT|nr:hypothetical protein [Clostridium boliviensis]MDW2800582.1 hypothetical protein [Clostridium boliviensis]
MKKIKCIKSCLFLSMALFLGNTAFTTQAKAETMEQASAGGQGVLRTLWMYCLQEPCLNPIFMLRL